MYGNNVYSSRGARARLLPLLSMVSLLAMSAACSATGMGFYQSCDGVDKATFGFSWRSNDNHFQGSYHDIGVMTGTSNLSANCVATGVKFQGDGTLGQGSTGICGVDENGNQAHSMDGIINYTSQDPNVLGAGQFHLFVCDTGHTDSTGNRVGDFIAIEVLTGPFMGYTNAGTVLGGNITVHQN
jgi:hypothetical protein